MKIRDIITERQQQRVMTMYHGTSSKLVPSILKNGLLAKAPKKTYDVDTYGDATASMGGVYIAPEREFAEYIAGEAVQAHGGEPAMVTLQYVKGSGGTDEDEITQAIGDGFAATINKYKISAPKDQLGNYPGLSYPAEGWAVDQMIKDPARAATEVARAALAELQQFAKARQVVGQHIKQIAIELIKRAGVAQSPRDRWSELKFKVQENIRVIPQLTQVLEKLMNQVSVDGAAGEGERARRLDRDVKFKGKTRILKVEIGNRQVYPRA
jgi:hypothetical protein